MQVIGDFAFAIAFLLAVSVIAFAFPTRRGPKGF